LLQLNVMKSLTKDDLTQAAPQMAAPVTTLTVFSFAGGMRWWAFAQMGLARPLLVGAPGLRFHKLMGAGRGLGFSIRPDWGRYALLAVWEDEAYARHFLANSRFMRRYHERAVRMATVMLRTITAHGAWDGRNPFLPLSAAPADYRGPLAVLTRATIRPWRLAAFWRRMGQVSKQLAGVPGRVASIGVGEAPFVRQATFSIWESNTAMHEFAYHSPTHLQTIAQTRRDHWYSEELFARFMVVEISEQFP
jgi:heme-degrading monooxygenase HmoA